MDHDRRFIEETFPVKEVSVESAKEKNIRHGHISTLHIWWARRPLASSRATAYAALIPAPKDEKEREEKKEFIIKLSKWENSLRADLIEKARWDILEANGGKPPRVLDPFAGGGAIPLEALRLGCEVYASDYNPVAVLIEKCTLEYPQKYGGSSGFGVRDSGGKEREEDEELQGIGGLAERDKSCGGDIQDNQKISSTGEVRTGLPVTKGSGIDPGEHSGGMGEGIDEGIHPVSVDRQGVADGTGNAPYCGPEAGLYQGGFAKGNKQGDRKHRNDAQSFGQEPEEEIGLFPKSELRNPNPLLADVKCWGQWVLVEAKKEIGRFYPEDDDGSIPVGYIWARTIPCQNPSCGAEIPLMRQFWLAKKPGSGTRGSGKRRLIALYPVIDRIGKKVDFVIVQRSGDQWEIIQPRQATPDSRTPNSEPRIPADFDPSKGTVSRAVATCLVCRSVVDAKTTRRLFQEGDAGQRMVAVVLSKRRGSRPGTRGSGKAYRVATERDLEAYKAAEEYLVEKREKLMAEWGMDPVPDEPLTRVPVTFGVINVWVYGMNTWGDLFNARQKLALVTFVEKVRKAYDGIWGSGFGIWDSEFGARESVDKEGSELPKPEIRDPKPVDYAKAVVSYLGLGINRLATYIVTLTRWRSDVLSFERAFDRQAIPMVWDYGEVNPYSNARGQWDLQPMLEAIKHTSRISIPVSIFQSTATSLPYPDNHFDAVFTDPPYYDNVPYSYLSDFFYVWLKRTIGDIYPDMFSTPLTPKKDEIVAYSNGPGGWEDGKAFFEEMLKKSFQEIHRILKPDGVAVIVYAHKSTSGWETLINSLLDSNLIMTGAWPIHTEMKARLRAHESATLASSIYIVARKMKRDPTGFYTDVREELKDHLDRKLEQLWEEGISGSDFFIAAIGSAIEVFGKYEKVMDYEGNVIRADRLLLDVQKIATDYAVRQILQDGFSGEISDMTRFYVLWRWEYGEAKVHFDDARKLAMSCNLDISKEWGGSGFIKKEKEFIRVLGPQNRKLEDLKDPKELVDILHTVLLHWEKGKREEMMSLLQKSGYGKHELFYRVAQAISETLPNDSKEKKLLDGFLAGRSRLRDALGKGDTEQIEMEI